MNISSRSLSATPRFSHLTSNWHFRSLKSNRSINKIKQILANGWFSDWPKHCHIWNPPFARLKIDHYLKDLQNPIFGVLVKLLDSFYSWDNVSKVNKKISTFSGANQNWVLHVISFFNFNINSRNFHFKKTRNLTQN